MGDSIHSPANGFTLLQWMAVICQEMQQCSSKGMQKEDWQLENRARFCKYIRHLLGIPNICRPLTTNLWALLNRCSVHSKPSSQTKSTRVFVTLMTNASSPPTKQTFVCKTFNYTMLQQIDVGILKTFFLFTRLCVC